MSDVRETESELKRTAIHEAGHAVMALILQESVLYVSIQPTDRTAGECGFPARELSDLKLVEVENAVLKIMAGYVSEEIHFGSISDGFFTIQEIDGIKYGAGDCMQIALCFKHMGIRENLPAELDVRTEKCKELLSTPSHRKAVLNIADALLTKTTLIGKEVEALYLRALNPKSRPKKPKRATTEPPDMGKPRRPREEEPPPKSGKRKK